MNLPNRLTTVMSPTIPATRHPASRHLTDDLRSLLSDPINLNAIRAMDLIVRKHTILKNKPARTPSLAIVDPLVKDPGDPITDDVFEHQLVSMEVGAEREAT